MNTPNMAGSAREHAEGEPRREEAIVSRIRADNVVAFEDLFRTYYGDLVRFARTRIQDLCIAEELVQDVFLDMWRRRRDLHPKCTLRAYLYAAILYKCNDHLRKQYVRVRFTNAVKLRFERSGAVRDPENMMQFAQLRQAIDKAIEDLPERRRTVFMLSRLQGLSNVEIAAIMNISVKTVENHMTAALRTLRERLLPLCAAD